MKATSRTDPKNIHISECGRLRLVKEGTVIDHPEAFRLCMMGVAKPVDDECLKRLAYEGWGPEHFDDKWQAAADQMEQWEAGIRAANTSTPAPIEGQDQPQPLTTEATADDSGDPDSGSVLFDSETSED
jgi:hypothetical protein